MKGKLGTPNIEHRTLNVEGDCRQDAGSTLLAGRERFQAANIQHRTSNEGDLWDEWENVPK